ncbi:MAG: Gfo/Idh/MocA family oxidoreductase [Gemmataceae bacterium]|nr:Gfo/Idh/MocA family oxidoreductase [Gemmataceae bacterium]
MSESRFALFGAGFWAGYQLAGWGEVAGARCVAVCDPDRAKTEALAKRFGVPGVYTDPAEVYRREKLDFVDIVTPPDTHGAMVRLAAANKTPAICQKPLCPTLGEARAVAAECAAAGIPLLVHENWRWQEPLRELKRVLDSGVIGPIFRGRVTYLNSFPVFDNQPTMKEFTRFILADIGVHTLDVVRWLFGECESLYAVTRQVNPSIKGEDVATVLLKTSSGAGITCEMSYASRVEHDRFPETYVLAEGERGTAELGPDYWVRVTTADGTHARRCPPPRYAWADPRYDLAHASVVPCHRNLLAGLRGEGAAETTAADNLKTLELVFGAYESAEAGRAVRPGDVR